MCLWEAIIKPVRGCFLRPQTIWRQCLYSTARSRLEEQASSGKSPWVAIIETSDRHSGAAHLRLEVICLDSKKNIFQLDSDWQQNKCQHCKFNCLHPCFVFVSFGLSLMLLLLMMMMIDKMSMRLVTHNRRECIHLCLQDPLGKAPPHPHSSPCCTLALEPACIWLLLKRTTVCVEWE